LCNTPLRKKEMATSTTTKASKESNVLRTDHGASITPYLHTTASKKNGGMHHVLLRVSQNKQHIYLDTDIFVPVKEFNSDTKGLKKPDQQLELRRLLVEALKIANKVPDNVRLEWENFRKGELAHQWLDVVTDLMQEDSLEKLLVKRTELENQLVEVNNLIKELADNIGKDIVKEAPSQQAVLDYKRAVDMFMASLQGKKQRDQNAFTSFFNVLEKCSKAKKFILSLDVFDMSFYYVYAKFLLDDRDCYNNTLGANIKKLKAFLSFAEAKGFAVNQGYKDKAFKILEETKKVVYIDDVELENLWNMKAAFPNNSKVIDLAVFQNLTGLRIGDAMQKHTIVTENGKKFLTSTTQKTEGTYMIPLSLDSRILEILQTYDNNMKILAEAVFNRELKTLMSKMYKYYNLEEPIITYYRYKLTERYRFDEPKSELLSSHSNRRGFITRNINSGDFDSTDVMKMIGSIDFKTMQKYIKTESDALDSKASASSLKKLQRNK
jgi:hypothetical protein